MMMYLVKYAESVEDIARCERLESVREEVGRFYLWGAAEGAVPDAEAAHTLQGLGESGPRVLDLLYSSQHAAVVPRPGFV